MSEEQKKMETKKREVQKKIVADKKFSAEKNQAKLKLEEELRMAQRKQAALGRPSAAQMQAQRPRPSGQIAQSVSKPVRPAELGAGKDQERERLLAVMQEQENKIALLEAQVQEGEKIAHNVEEMSMKLELLERLANEHQELKEAHKQAMEKVDAHASRSVAQKFQDAVRMTAFHARLEGAHMDRIRVTQSMEKTLKGVLSLTNALNMENCELRQRIVHMEQEREAAASQEETRLKNILQTTQERLTVLHHVGQVFLPPAKRARDDLSPMNQPNYTGFSLDPDDRMATAPDQTLAYEDCVETAKKLRAVPLTMNPCPMGRSSAAQTLPGWRASKGRASKGRVTSVRAVGSLAPMRAVGSLSPACPVGSLAPMRDSMRVSMRPSAIASAPVLPIEDEEQPVSQSLAGQPREAGTKAFRQFLLYRYGGLWSAWRAMAGKFERLTLAQFCGICRQYGKSWDPRGLFRNLLVESGITSEFCSYITARHLDPLGYDAYYAFMATLETFGSVSLGWSALFADQTRVSKAVFEDTLRERLDIAHPKKVFRWIETRGVVYRDVIRSLARCDAAQWTGHVGIDGMKEQLCKWYGTMLRAWRRGFDPDNYGSVPFSIFSSVLRDAGIPSAKEIWRSLYPGDRLTLKDLDEDAYMHFSAFDKLIRETFGDYVFAWTAALDMDDNNQVEVSEFQLRLKYLEYPHDVKHLCHLLQPNRAIPFLTIENLDRKSADEYWKNGAPPEALALKPRLGKLWHENVYSKEKIARAVARRAQRRCAEPIKEENDAEHNLTISHGDKGVDNDGEWGIAISHIDDVGNEDRKTECAGHLPFMAEFPGDDELQNSQYTGPRTTECAGYLPFIAEFSGDEELQNTQYIGPGNTEYVGDMPFMAEFAGDDELQNTQYIGPRNTEYAGDMPFMAEFAGDDELRNVEDNYAGELQNTEFVGNAELQNTDFAGNAEPFVADSPGESELQNTEGILRNTESAGNMPLVGVIAGDEVQNLASTDAGQLQNAELGEDLKNTEINDAEPLVAEKTE